jgi:hypothetical protein
MGYFQHAMASTPRVTRRSKFHDTFDLARTRATPHIQNKPMTTEKSVVIRITKFSINFLSEEKMSDQMLNIVGATRWNNCSAIIGDYAALQSLRDALDDALQTGSGGALQSTSDGEYHAVAVILEDDMNPVYTTYADEPSPVRSGRETVPIHHLENYRAAMEKAHEMESVLPETCV